MNKLLLMSIAALVGVGLVTSAYALQQTAGSFTLQLSPGETKTSYYMVRSTEGNTATVTCSGDGCQYLAHASTLELPKNVWVRVYVTATIPEGEPLGSYTPAITVTECFQGSGSTTLCSAMKKTVNLNIV